MGKKYIVDNIELMVEWDWEKNNELRLEPSILSIGSHKVAFWVCSTHKIGYKQVIRDKARGQRGCLVCLRDYKSKINRERCIKDREAVAVTHPNLVVEWIVCEDPQITPYTCVAGSNSIVKWKCQKCGGEYKASIVNRALKGTACPYCAGQKVLAGYNDLQSLAPDLSAEWSDKNIAKPTEFTMHSKKRVYWICPLGHEDYLLSIQQRNNRQGCPICAQQSQTSFPEQAIYYYIKQVFPDANNRYKYQNREIDIFIPSKNIGVEYNGYFSHKNKKEKDILKKHFFHSVGIDLIVIKEYKYDNEKIDADFYIQERTTYTDLTNLICKLLFSICKKTPIDINCERDSILIKEQYLIQRKNNSIAQLRPDLAKEWDAENNGKITPDLIAVGSNQKYYWKCPICNNKYKASPKNRSHDTGCPICSSKSVMRGFNDLKTVYPHLLDEWDYKQNLLDPSDVLAGGTTAYYWMCPLGHSYPCTIPNRIKGYNCSICAGKKVLQGYNDLQTVNPTLAKEWNYGKNHELTPRDVSSNSNKKVWWKCQKGHEWQAMIGNRNKGRGCPQCAREKRKKK